MTAKQALKHEWLKTTQDFNLLPNVRKNFNARRTFKKAVLAAMAAKQMKSPKSASPLSPAAPPAVTTEATAAETPKE